MNIWPWSRIRALEEDKAALTAANETINRWRKEDERALLASNDRIQDELTAKSLRLERIAALETPSCASIGKRMAKIARGEG